MNRKLFSHLLLTVFPQLIFIATSTIHDYTIDNQIINIDILQSLNYLKVLECFKMSTPMISIPIQSINKISCDIMFIHQKIMSPLSAFFVK